MFRKKSDNMESRVIFKKNRNQRNGYVNDEYNADDNENGYSDDDDVFVEDPMLEISSATKPLMHPRQRARVKSKHPDCKLKLICKPVLYFVLFVSVLGGLMSLILYTVNKHPQGTPSTEITLKVTAPVTSADVIGCDHIEVEDVWVIGFPKLITESSVRLVDVNQDGVLDVITGFATGVDGYSIPEFICDIYFDGVKPCYGGLIALEGKTGKELWRQYSKHEIFGVICPVDFNQDGVLDCLAGGRAAAFDSISGKDGKILWRFGGSDGSDDIMNFYTAQVISDMDGDTVPDILAVHGGDPLQDPGSPYRLSGKILLMSGKTGKVLRNVGVPDQKEAYYSPQIYLQKDGTEMVLFGTGGETHGGSLWRITLHDLIKGRIEKAARIYTDNFKGVMTPPVLIDLNHDDVVDIVISMFNSTTLAIDGSTFEMIWNYTFPLSESYCTPAVGYYNDDDIPDFMVKYAYGPGFPIYYSAQTTILDGRTGTPMLPHSINDTVGAQASPLTISVEGRGNDIFLYWIADCIHHEGEGGMFDFVKGTNVHEQSRSDFCRLRFKTKGFTEMYAIGRNIKLPGVKVYNSEDRKVVEHASWVNTTLEAIEFVKSHPEHLKRYNDYTNRDQMAKEKLQNKDKGNTQPSEEVTEQNYQGTRTSSGGKKGFSGSRERAGPRERLQQHQHNNRQNNRQRNNNQGRHQDRQRQQQQRGRVPGYPYSMESPFSSYYSNGEDDPEAEAKNRGSGRYDDPRYPTYKRSQYKDKHTVDPLAMKERSSKSEKDILKESIESRLKRHVGPHDDAGLQRLISTGAVVPTTLPDTHPDYNHTIEVVFATYWFFPAKTQAILADDQKCISGKLAKEAERTQPSSKYYGMDHDAYEHTIVQECLKQSGHDAKSDDGRTYESQSAFNPYNVHMGQMTVYRIRLKCTCSNMADIIAKNKQCSKILPYDQQEWPAYMGFNGDSHWRSRYRH